MEGHLAGPFIDFSLIALLLRLFSIVVSAGIKQCWKPRGPDPSHCSSKCFIHLQTFSAFITLSFPKQHFCITINISPNVCLT